ncbi:hypothetical protein L1987_70761 [Smallanthus sonchifolius]|uniref:Uncharacterized protein n=1 Tax=Smallanthus sonchifolius TaxID=185202 RepID=A0ACB9AUV7_9ASTR|nr:hypothetical protein L1987_70761 [Smallanthus sonchifolius]
MRLHHYQNLMDQVISQLSATHIELHRARDLIEDPVWEIQRLRMKVTIAYAYLAYKICTLNPTYLIIMQCPMWLPAESSGTKSDARSTFVTQKDLKSNSTSPWHENTVSAPMRLERPKARTRQNARYFDWKDEVNESLGWLTSLGTDMKDRLDFHIDLATVMSGKMNELEQDIMKNHDRTTATMRDARIARIQSRVAITVALVVSLASIFIQLYR